VVPRFCTKLVEINQFPLGTEIWENTFIKLPKNIGHSGWDLINEQPVRLIELTPVGNILKYFPTAVILTNKEN
jgi:(1->4)-alpha-D-glucan 1-alpha-D-glucosylmutase